MKRVLAMLLSAAMIATCLPQGVMAEEPDADVMQVQEDFEDAAYEEEFLAAGEQEEYVGDAAVYDEEEPVVEDAPETVPEDEDAADEMLGSGYGDGELVTGRHQEGRVGL